MNTHSTHVGRLLALALMGALLVTAITLSFDARPGRAANENSITVPDSEGVPGQFSSLRLDASGFPIISYKGADGGLKLMHCNDANCAGNDESIQSFPGLTTTAVTSTSLRLDATGFPVIAVASILQLKIVHCNDVSCAGGDESIATPPSAGFPEQVSLVLDTNGFPAVAVRVTTQNALNSPLGVLRCNDVNCSGTGETFEQPVGGLLDAPSIQVDAAGFPVIAFRRTVQATVSGDLLILHCNDLSCAGGDENLVLSPDSAGAVGTFPSLVLDVNGFPVVSYGDEGNGTLKVMHCNDVNCAGADDATNTVTNAAAGAGRSTSMALDANGFPVVSTYAGNANATQVIHCNDANCAGGDESAVTVDNVGGDGQGTSLVLDASGFPVVSYFASLPGSEGELRVLHCGDANCSVPAPPPPTATPTATLTPLPPTTTSTPTVTPTSEPPTPTATPTSTSAPTNTATTAPTIEPATAVPTATETPTGTPTDTPVPTATSTPITPPTNTSTATATPTSTTAPTDTPVPTATSTPTTAPTSTSTATSTATSTTAPTDTPVPTATSTPTTAPTSTSTATATATGTTAPTDTPVPTATSTPTTAPTNTSTATSTATATPTSTNTPVATATSTTGPRCADLTGDGIVRVNDLFLMVRYLSRRLPYDARFDIDRNGRVNVLDLLAVLRQFGRRC